MNSWCARRRLFLAVLVLAGAAAQAIAQVDFSGEWAPRFHEDQPERVPGPQLATTSVFPSTMLPA
jgi:hypothetical protein